jgi:cytochrome c553
MPGAIDDIGDRKPGGRLFQGTCSGYHVMRGASIIPTSPRLSGQVANFLLFQWSLFKSVVRHDPPGHAKMKGIGDREIRSIASYLSAEQAGAPWPSKNPAIGNGMQLAVAPLTSDDILAVSECMAGMGYRRQFDRHVMANEEVSEPISRFN